MKNRQEIDISAEKIFFLNQVKKNPLFLLQHLKALSSVILDQYKSKYFTTVRGKHLSTKKPMPWLSQIKSANRSQCQNVDQLMQRIPDFTLAEIPEKHLPSSAPFTQTQFPDVEEYLAKNRWGVLLDTLLTAKPDPNLPDNISQQLEYTFSKKDPAWETYSACERVANLLIWTAFVGRFERQQIPPTLLTFLEDSLQWILKHLEFYGAKTGNHILNNARAIILAGTVLNNKAAVETGMLIFQNMLPVLIQPNGFLRERSSHYQLIVLGWLLDAHAFLQATEFYPAAKVLEPTIISMRYATAHICDKAGYLQAFIGDVSPDIAPYKTTQRLARCYPQSWPTYTPEKEGAALRDDWGTLVAGNSKIILNCPRGNYPKVFSSHAHNDISSFVWLQDDEQVLIDCGRARYTKDPVSSRQKSALGHSLAFVNGFAPLSESLVINGNWWPTPYASASVAIKTLADNSIVITHDGFKRATPVNEHERKISLQNACLQVTDLFRGHGEVEIETRWQLHPGFMLVDGDNWRFSNGNLILDIDLSAMHFAPHVEFVPADLKRSRYSSEYGHAVPNPFILLRWKVKLPFITQIVFKVRSCVG